MSIFLNAKVGIKTYPSMQRTMKSLSGIQKAQAIYRSAWVQETNEKRG